MKVSYTKSFLKDVKKLDAKIRQRGLDVIEDIKSCVTFDEIKNIRKLSGYKNYHRIRMGDYRIGSKFEDGELVFIRFQHRSNIYKVFP